VSAPELHANCFRAQLTLWIFGATAVLLKAQLVQLVFHKEQVCTCGQIEVQLSQQHGRL